MKWQMQSRTKVFNAKCFYSHGIHFEYGLRFKMFRTVVKLGVIFIMKYRKPFWVKSNGNDRKSVRWKHLFCLWWVQWSRLSFEHNQFLYFWRCLWSDVGNMVAMKVGMMLVYDVSEKVCWAWNETGVCGGVPGNLWIRAVQTENIRQTCNAIRYNMRKSKLNTWC